MRRRASDSLAQRCFYPQSVRYMRKHFPSVPAASLSCSPRVRCSCPAGPPPSLDTCSPSACSLEVSCHLGDAEQSSPAPRPPVLLWLLAASLKSVTHLLVLYLLVQATHPVSSQSTLHSLVSPSYPPVSAQTAVTLSRVQATHPCELSDGWNPAGSPLYAPWHLGQGLSQCLSVLTIW